MLALLPLTAYAQNELAGKDRFPEFRTFSALPGVAYGVDEYGQPSIKGAMAISSPIAHSLGQDRWVFGIGNTSLRGGLRFFQDRNALADGTGWAITGVRTPYGNLTIGGMLLSTQRDTVLNLHFSPKTEWENITVAVGAQDLFSTGGSSGEAIDLPQGGGVSRSLYGVATLKLLEGAYLSAGVGTRRFARGFFSASFNPIQNLSIAVENDGFNWNVGASYRVAEFQLKNRPVTANVFVGQIRGKYWNWAFGLSF